MSGRWAVDMEKRTASVLQRDGWICWICRRAGATTADHVVPRSKGGSNDLTNLRAAHRGCNSRKGNRIALPRARPSRW